MNVVFEKELPKSEKIEIVREIIKIFCKKGVTFGQAFELLSDVQVELILSEMLQSFLDVSNHRLKEH